MGKSRVKTVEAVYTVTEYFDIPEDVYLLKDSDNLGKKMVCGSWWVRWGILYYIDKELNLQEIHHDDDVREQMQRPDTTKTEQTDDEEEEEEEEEQEVEDPNQSNL